MIKLTKLDGEQLVVNAELIESINCGNDTLLSLTSGRKLIVRESPEEIVQRVLEYRAQALPGPLAVPVVPAG